MPDALSTNWLTVPLGLTQVTATDWFIPNEVEFATISNMDAFVDKNIIEYGNSISGNLIVTLGEEGAASVAEGSVSKIPAPKVKAVDITGKL